MRTVRAVFRVQVMDQSRRVRPGSTLSWMCLILSLTAVQSLLPATSDDFFFEGGRWNTVGNAVRHRRHLDSLTESSGDSGDDEQDSYLSVQV